MYFVRNLQIQKQKSKVKFLGVGQVWASKVSSNFFIKKLTKWFGNDLIPNQCGKNGIDMYLRTLFRFVGKKKLIYNFLNNL
jgi:hypothetical protein